nr:unnamed protein product [Fasciola hepatica]
MKCPNELSRPTMFSIGRKSVDLNLGDLCGTGNEDSWIDIAMVGHSRISKSVPSQQTTEIHTPVSLRTTSEHED